MSIYVGTVDGATVRVSDHHPDCECGMDGHYGIGGSGCQLKDRDAVTAEDWRHIADHKLAQAVRLREQAYQLELEARLAVGRTKRKAT